MNEILRISHLFKNYGSIPALNDISLDFEKGKIVGLLGPNGSGKTTLIKIVTGLLTYNNGEVLIDGNHPGVTTKKIVSYLPDKNFLDEGMTILQAVRYHDDFFEDFDHQKAINMILDLGLTLKTQIKTLSKGNKEKLGLILCLSRNAKLFILDEPIAGVDPAARDYILSTIINNRNPESTMIISTHLIADIQPILQDVVFIDHGHIRLHATPEQIMEVEHKNVDELFREVFKW